MDRADCFLDDPEWTSALHTEAGGPRPPQNVSLSDEHFEALAALPGLVKSTNSLLRSANPSEERIQGVLERARCLQARFNRWYSKLTVGSVAPFYEDNSRIGDELFPRVYCYVDNHTTGLVCSYYAALMVLNDIMSSLPPCEDLSVENNYYARQICKSVEFASRSGFQGAYSIIFPLTAAYLASDSATRAWIKNWPKRFDAFFDIRVWQVFDNMDAKGGIIDKMPRARIGSG